MRVGLGIAGTGRWADAHARATTRSDRLEIVSCFSRTSERRAQFRDRHGLRRDAASLEELLEDPEVQGIVISTPNDLHVEQAMRAIDVRKPVLIDKPVSVDIAGGLRLMRRARDQGVPVGVAHHARRLAGHRATRSWVASGEAGTVRLAYADFSNNRGGAMKPEAWHRHVPGAEAGVVIQVGIHQIDTLQYLLGPATSVNARFEYGALGREMPDAAVVVMRHASGAISTVTSSWTTPSHYRTVLLATGGNMEFRLDHGHWTSGDVDDHGELVLEPPDGDRRPFPSTKGDPLRDQLEELADAATIWADMSVSITDGLRATAVVEAAVRSAADGGTPVDIDEILVEAGATESERRLLTTGVAGS